MATWGNADVLIDTLQRQLGLLQSGDTEQRMLSLGRWLGFLRREPQLAGLITELVAETRRALNELTREDGEVRDVLLELWKQHEQLLRSCLSDELENEQLYAYGTMNGFADAVSERPTIPLPRWQVFDEDKMETEGHVLAMKHWASWAIQRAERVGTPVDDALVQIRDRVTECTLALQFLKRRLRAVVAGSAGAALYRLQEMLREAMPKPPQRDEQADEEAAEAYAWDVAIFERANEFADRLHSKRSLSLRQLEADEVTAAAITLSQDAELVTRELQLRILAGRSRLVLVRRYAAQCEGFDANMLRKRLRSERGKVERELTLDFAKYLFQQGLSPILDATIGGLRPDVLDDTPGALLYVEAKQYGETAPRAKIEAAYRQVWSTWGRLANLRNVPEAFLLVFRVAGPRVELPPVLRHDGRVLYSVLADISKDAGSRDRTAALAFSADELLPATNSDSSR